jgi:hypothetical protein
MAKVEGSNPFIRFERKPCRSRGFLLSGVRSQGERVDAAGTRGWQTSLNRPVERAAPDSIAPASYARWRAPLLAARVLQVDERHPILLLEFPSAEEANRVARVLGGPWIREHIPPLPATGTQRSVGGVIPSA